MEVDQVRFEVLHCLETAVELIRSVAGMLPGFPNSPYFSTPYGPRNDEISCVPLHDRLARFGTEGNDPQFHIRSVLLKRVPQPFLPAGTRQTLPRQGR